MSTGDKAADGASQSGPSFPSYRTVDLLIIGGGIMGLWAALFARRAGLGVHLADAGPVGGGASGGLLGALMPHMPDRWSDKKQLQFDALVSLEAEIARLEAETGLSAGYRRTGRLIPLGKPHLRTIALGHEADALAHWRKDGRPFYWHVRDQGFAGDLLAPEAIASGWVHDTLAARVSPRRLTAVLRAVLEADRGVSISQQTGVARLDGAVGRAVLSDGSELAFHHAVIAAGAGSAPLLAALSGPFAKPVLVPVKGQAALLRAGLDPDMPVIYRDGLYVVPHENGEFAIGSTSENRFAEPFSTDSALDDLVAAAVALMPGLAGADVIERWAGLRPKAIGRDPMVGPLPGHARLSVLTGGFKVSFGVAHLLSAALVSVIAGAREETGLPASFDPSAHLDLAGGRPA